MNQEPCQRCQYSAEEKLVHRTELLFHATKHFKVKKWVRSKKRREDMTYQALLQYAKEHEMTVKDFNCHKSNGGITQLTTVDVIKTFKHAVRKVSNPAAHIERVVRVPETAKHAVSATLLINLKTVQHLAKNAINVVLRIISVHAVDLHGAKDKAQTSTEVEHQHMVGALRDITDPAEAGTPDPDHVQGVVHKLETPIA